MAKHESLRLQQAEEGVKTLDCILEALEAELALESELGVRLVGIDRQLLKPLEVASPLEKDPGEAIERETRPIENVKEEVKSEKKALDGATRLEYVFLHDRPLEGEAQEMMEKIVSKLGKDSKSAPIVYSRPFPDAKSYVVLGGNALKKFFPGRSAKPGDWIKGDKGEDLLISYSPKYILKFTRNSVEQIKVKKDMWRGLQAIPRHLAAVSGDR